MKTLKELEKLTEEEKLVLERCRDAIREVDPSADVILYGSRARGDDEATSDYDLLVLIDGEASLEKEDIICRQLYPIELETGKVLLAMVYSREQWDAPLYRAMPFHKNVERDGVLV
jgi:predicted nucleotidyltransferase